MEDADSSSNMDMGSMIMFPDGRGESLCIDKHLECTLAMTTKNDEPSALEIDEHFLIF
jgi:hypothetical protein